jgi:uncharacterized protein YjbJ (UPF0337 family)
MKALPWVFAGIGAGIAAAYVLMNQPRMQAETGWDSVENTADRAFGWGSRNRISGAARNIAGKVKEGVGRVMGDGRIADQGVADQAVGSATNAMGSVAQAAGETLHDLNR